MKRNNDDFEFLCILISVETERYKKNYDELKKKKNDDINKVKENYVPGSKLHSESLETIHNKYNVEVDELKAEYTKVIGDAVDKVRAKELERVQTVNETKLSKIKSIADIPMNADELIAISEKYETDGDYWCSRLLCNIAEYNGIEGFEKYTEANYSLKNDILNQITDQATEMIRYYDGHDQLDAEARQRTLYVLLSDKVLEHCRKLWNGENNVVSDEDAVTKAYLTVYSKRTDIEKGLAIANVLKNAKGEKRNLLMCRLAEDKNISNFAFKLSGFSGELMEFRNGKAGEYLKAKSIIEKITKEEDNEKRQELYTRYNNNPFLKDLIKEESKRNEFFLQFVGEYQSNQQGD